MEPMEEDERNMCTQAQLVQHRKMEPMEEDERCTAAAALSTAS